MHEDGMDFRDRERAAATLHFRNELRQVHKDVRMNTRVCKHSWAIITAVTERKVNLSLTSTVQRIAPKDAALGKNAKRKKRAQSDDDENMQSPPQPSKGKKKTKVTPIL
jgi:CRISPR/Cas system-associated endonuclease Cas3-HD